MFGFLNVYKPAGKTSHDVVSVIRRISGVKQVGHTGTLDPLAEGVLPVCIGKATRLIEYLKEDKAYVGTVRLGEATTTYDLEGEVLKCSDKNVSFDEVENALFFFRGEIEQFPPIYSAIKINGKKLYEYARKNEEVKIPPRKVQIYDLKVLNYNPADRVLELYIKCSKGTYIRSIANDLGERLGTYGHLIKLERVQAGDFHKENSVKLEDLKTAEDIEKNLIYPLGYLDYPKYKINSKEAGLISNGRQINVNAKDGLTILVRNSELIAVGYVKDSVFKCAKVFI